MKTKNEIWVVCGSSGEYEDKKEWMVVAYSTEAAAKEHAQLANTKSNEFQEKAKGGYYKNYSECDEAFIKCMKEVDDSEDITFDHHTGIVYNYKKIPFKNKIDVTKLDNEDKLEKAEIRCEKCGQIMKADVDIEYGSHLDSGCFLALKSEVERLAEENKELRMDAGRLVSAQYRALP